MKEVFIITSIPVINGKTAGSQRILKIAKSLSLADANVFLCSLADIGEGNIVQTAIYPNIFRLTSNNNKKSISHLFNFLSSLNKFIKERKTESVIYLYPTSKIFHDFVYLIYFKLLRKNKIFCEINELRSTNLYTKTPPSNSFKKIVFYLKYPLVLLIYKVSEIQTFFYDGLIVISTNLDRYFTRYTRKIIRIPILCDISTSISTKHSPYYKDEPFKICFSGTVNSRKEGFNLLFEALENVNKQKKVELHLYGTFSGSDRSEINELIKKYDLNEKVLYHGLINPDDLTAEFLKYNLLILPRPATKQNKYGFSTKLSEYMVSGVPVLVTAVSDNKLYIKDGFNGYLVAPGSSSEMTSKIFSIIDNYNNDDSIASNAYKTAAKEFDYKLYTQKLIKFFFNETVSNN
jgi:glycosyltransferase involved in cell wall biosynthesis